MNKCDCEVDRLSVETERAIYKIRFGEIQIEITGRCNMNCRHCRGSPDKESGDMPVDQILKIIRFGRQFSSNHSQIVLSGGEPLMHRDFFRVLDVVRANGCDELTLTTNGSLFTSEHMREINGRNFDKVVISVSLDSLDPNDHDEFRQHVGAFQSVHKAIETILSERSPAVVLSLKMTLRPHQVAEMPKMVAYAFKLGCDRVSLSSVCPSGKAITDTALWMNSAEKRRFLETIFRLRKEYSSTFMIDTNDPLKCILRGHSEIGGEGEIVFDGCPAAAVTFNVNANGDLTPCSLLNLPVMNVFGMTVEEMTERYRESDIVKNMLDMKLHGKCGECKHKYQCGGCRARALVQSGDYLGEDPHCWL